MSAQDNLGQQFIKLYRGVHADNRNPEDTSNLKNLGIHWTPHRRAARSFASGESLDLSHDYYKDRGIKPEGLVYTALVHKDHVVKVGTDEWKELSSRHSIQSPGENTFEREKTVRRGSPLKIIGIEKVTGELSTEHPYGVKTVGSRKLNFEGGMGTA